MEPDSGPTQPWNVPWTVLVPKGTDDQGSGSTWLWTFSGSDRIFYRFERVVAAKPLNSLLSSYFSFFLSPPFLCSDSIAKAPARRA